MTETRFGRPLSNPLRAPGTRLRQDRCTVARASRGCLIPASGQVFERDHTRWFELICRCSTEFSGKQRAVLFPPSPARHRPRPRQPRQSARPRTPNAFLLPDGRTVPGACLRPRRRRRSRRYPRRHRHRGLLHSRPSVRLLRLSPSARRRYFPAPAAECRARG
jgi:hypothetical protein